MYVVRMLYYLSYLDPVIPFRLVAAVKALFVIFEKSARMGPSIKYVTLQGGGGLRKCEFVTGGGVKIM